MQWKKQNKIRITAAVLIILSYLSIKIDDAIVLRYIVDNMEEGYGVWIVGSNLTVYEHFPAREYIFTVGVEGTLEIVVSRGKVVSFRELSKIPHMWTGYDFRLKSDEKWR